MSHFMSFFLRLPCSLMPGPSVLMLAMILSCLTGCIDCEKRFCRGVRVSSAHLMSVADRCCLEPSLPGCEDPEGFFQRVLERMMMAYDACHEDNYERMKDILDGLLGLLPVFSLESICEEPASLDDSLREWLDGRCALLRNAGPVFDVADTVSLSILMPLTSAEERLDDLAWTSDGRFGARSTSHPFQSGSALSFDAWFGSGKASLDGGLVLGSERSLPGGGRIIPVREAVFELDSIGSRPGCRILATELEGSTPGVCGWIVLDDSGDGRLGLRLSLDDPQGGRHGPIWFECPVLHQGRRLHLETDGSSMALDLFPVVDSIHRYFEMMQDPSFSITDESGFDPCERIDGATRRALAWLQRLRLVFPDCFSSRGR